MRVKSLAGQFLSVQIVEDFNANKTLIYKVAVDWTAVVAAPSADCPGESEVTSVSVAGIESCGEMRTTGMGTTYTPRDVSFNDAALVSQFRKRIETDHRWLKNLTEFAEQQLFLAIDADQDLRECGDTEGLERLEDLSLVPSAELAAA